MTSQWGLGGEIAGGQHLCWGNPGCSRNVCGARNESLPFHKLVCKLMLTSITLSLNPCGTTDRLAHNYTSNSILYPLVNNISRESFSQLHFPRYAGNTCPGLQWNLGIPSIGKMRNLHISPCPYTNIKLVTIYLKSFWEQEIPPYTVRPVAQKNDQSHRL